MTNVLKHAHAFMVRVDLDIEDELIHLSVRDDGPGEADPVRGSALIGLNDRVEARSAARRIASPVGEGTSLLTTIALEPA